MLLFYDFALAEIHVHATGQTRIEAAHGAHNVDAFEVLGSVLFEERATLHGVLVGPGRSVDIARIRVGQNAVVTVDTYPGEAFTGRITNVSDTLDPTTRTAKVRCEVQNRDGRLKFQMFATLELPVSATHDALMVPTRAIQEIDGVPTVFVRVDEERFQPRPVRVGASVGDHVEIVDGLKPGDALVTEGALMLKSKLKLRVDAEEGEGKKK